MSLRRASLHLVARTRPARHHNDGHPFQFTVKPGREQFRQVLIKNFQTAVLRARRQEQMVIVKGERQHRVWLARSVSLAETRIDVVLAGLKSGAVQLGDTRLAAARPHLRVVTGTAQRGRKLLNLPDQRVALEGRQTVQVCTSRPPEVPGKMRVGLLLPVHAGEVRFRRLLQCLSQLTQVGLDLGLAARKLLSRPPHRKRSDRGSASGSEGSGFVRRRVGKKRDSSGMPR